MQHQSDQVGQFDFLSEYINALFDEIGLGDMSEAQKNVYIPRFTALLEERLGLTLVPQLTEDQIKEFVELVDAGEGTTGEDWSKFWHGAFDDFDQRVADILKEFGAQAKQLANNNS